MRGGRLPGRCDIIQFPLNRQKCSLLDRFEIGGLALKQQCSLPKQAVLKHDFCVLKEELSVRNPCQIHLDQRFFHRGFPPPVALDDRRLEGLTPELWHLQRHFAGLRFKTALVMASAGVPARLVALIAASIA